MKHWAATALLVLVTAFAHAQTVTPNLVTDPSFTTMSGWTATGLGSNASHPVVGVYQYSFGTQGSLAQSIAINNALSGTGISVTGIQYGWRFAVYCNNPVGADHSTCSNGTGAADTLTANINVTNSSGNAVFDRTHVYNTRVWAWIYEAQDVNFTSTPLASMGHINMTFTGIDAGQSPAAPYLGPSLANVYARLKYGVETVDPCIANPLYSTSCSGYQQAYTTQQCAANPLYSTACSGYAVAYKTQQCAANPLYATDCPGYAAAYLNQQCLLDSLFSTQCPGYKEAYAVKYLVTTNPVATTATNVATTVGTSDPAAVSATGNATVDSVVAAPAATSATSVTSPVSVVAPAPSTATVNSVAATPPPPAAAAEQKTEAKKTQGAVASVEKKAGGNATAARAAATEKAKELANDVSKAATLEAQTAAQGVLVGLIGYVPGFSAYQNSLVPDTMGATVAKQYYKTTVDNRSAQRQLSGANEIGWKQMVDSQYNKE